MSKLKFHSTTKIDDKTKYHLNLNSNIESEYFGSIIASYLNNKCVVKLQGHVGMGKSSICRGIIREFMSDELDVPSPTQLLCLNQKNEHNELFHIDPQRLKSTDKIKAVVDWQCILSQNIVLIEWADLVDKTNIDFTNNNTLEIRIEGVGLQMQGRQITIESNSTQWHQILSDWNDSKSVSFNKDYLKSIPTKDQKYSIDEFKNNENDKHSDWTNDDIIIGIESSCDDTGVALVKFDGTILAEMLMSQIGIHEEQGGVKPMVAKQQHMLNIDHAVEQVFVKAGIEPRELKAVSVTRGPGLNLCLEVGVRKALTISKENKIPIVFTHHMESHLIVNTNPKIMINPMKFPSLNLLVSGGHNLLIQSKSLGCHTIVGTTLDDSVGEAFDKVARELGILKIPGGPDLEKLALNGNHTTYLNETTKPFSKSRDNNVRTNCDFSFSGLKTNIKMLIFKYLKPDLPDEQKLKIREDIAAVFQFRAIQHLAERTSRALEWHNTEHFDQLVIAGGVAANQALRTAMGKVCEEHKKECVQPPMKQCVDNGVMVAWNGVENQKLGNYNSPPTGDVSNLIDVQPRWPIGYKDTRSKGQSNKVN